TDRDDAVRGIERYGLLAQLPRRVRRHRLDNVTDEAAVAGTIGLETRRFVTAPDNDVGRGLDIGDLVSVDDFFVAREVEDARPGGAQSVADRKQHRIAQP